MKEYIVINETSEGICLLVEVSNESKTIERSRESLIKSIKSDSIKILNRSLIKTNKGYSSTKWENNKDFIGLTSEQALFDMYLSYFIDFERNNFELPFIILHKIVEVYDRKDRFKTSNSFYSHLSLLLKRFFNYMGDTHYSLLGKSFLKTMELKKDILIDKELFESYLSKEVLNKLETERYCLGYKEFLFILDKLFSEKRSDINKEVLDNVVIVLTEFFNSVDFTFIGGYLYLNYLVDLKKAINTELSEGLFVFDEINEEKRVEKLNGSIAKTNNALFQYEQKLKEISKDYNKLVKKYKDVLPLLYKDVKDSKEKVGKSSLDEAIIHSYYSIYNIVNRYIDFTKTKLGREGSNNIVSMLTISRNISISLGMESLRQITGKAKTFAQVATFVKRRIKLANDKCLNPKTIEFLNYFQECNQVEIDILIFLMDTTRVGYKKEELVNLYTWDSKKYWKLYNNNPEHFKLNPIYSYGKLKELMVVYSRAELETDGKGLGGNSNMGLYGMLGTEEKVSFNLYWLSVYYFINLYLEENSYIWYNRDSVFFELLKYTVELIILKTKNRKLDSSDIPSQILRQFKDYLIREGWSINDIDLEEITVFLI